MSNVLAVRESNVRVLQEPSWDACKTDVASSRTPSRQEVLALSSKERAAARAEEELPDVEHDVPFDDSWPPDESQRPLDDEGVPNVDVPWRDEQPIAPSSSRRAKR